MTAALTIGTTAIRLIFSRAGEELAVPPATLAHSNMETVIKIQTASPTMSVEITTVGIFTIMLEIKMIAALIRRRKRKEA